LQDLKFRPGGEAQHPQFDHVKIFFVFIDGVTGTGGCPRNADARISSAVLLCIVGS
jgi:hypothetical protein